MNKVSLREFSNTWYQPGEKWKRVLWYIVNIIFFKSSIPFPYSFKSYLLKLFGADVGIGIVIKPSVNIKYPWFLNIGNYVWIGEGVWIDNLTNVKIGDNVCLSQGSLILTGNHDYRKVTFDLIVEPVFISEGTWVGAKAIICPGVTLNSHSVITAGSVVTRDTQPYMIYQGVPAELIRERVIS